MKIITFSIIMGLLAGILINVTEKLINSRIWLVIICYLIGVTLVVCIIAFNESKTK